MSSHTVTVHEWDADPDMGMPYQVRACIHDTIADLNAWRIDTLSDSEPGEAYGVTTYDDDGAISIHLAADGLHLGVIAHETVHYALFAYGHHILGSKPHATARAHITNHDETIPYMVGNVTALLVYGLRDLGYTIDPET